MLSSATVLTLTVCTLVVFTLLGMYHVRGRVGSVEDYISAPGTTGEGMTTATVIASNMGAWILFSPAEAGAAFGGLAAVLGYGIGSAGAMGLYVVVGPRIRRLIPEGHSLTEYALVRFGRPMHAYVVGVSIFYMFIFLAAEMTGIAGALSLIGNVPTWQTAGLIGLFVLVYTAYGGLKASIFTDTIQTLLILPLLVAGFGGALWQLGGIEVVYRRVEAANPDLLNPGFWPGVKFGIYVIVAIVGAEMLNQSWWQRIYAARRGRTLRRSFALAALAILPMIVLPGMFGLVATSHGWVNSDLADPGYNADTAFFRVLMEAFPAWLTLMIVLLAVLLVMSTADTLFNAISSLITGDLVHFYDLDESVLTGVARGVTVLVALGATVIGALGYSVLQLFLLADLLAAATFIPLLSGLFSARPRQWGVLPASLLGLLGGVVFFPVLRPFLAVLPGLKGVLPPASFLGAFLAAALLSGGTTLAASWFSAPTFDFDTLIEKIRRLEPDPRG